MSQGIFAKGTRPSIHEFKSKDIRFNFLEAEGLKAWTTILPAKMIILYNYNNMKLSIFISGILSSGRKSGARID